ncbi:ABC transporter transmembrane domain-containing protein, partial [Antarcticimicrobium luteum]
MSSRSATSRLITERPRQLLRQASVWAALSGALWPVQAGLIAWVIQGWTGGDFGAAGWIAAAGFALIGAIRAAADRMAGRRAFAAADLVVSAERKALLDREGLRVDRAVSSADLAALLSEKLALLAPYVARYRPAMARVRVVPLLFLALTAYFSWVAALILLIAGPLIPLFMALVGMAAKEASARQMVEIGDMNALLIDRIAALPDIRILDAADKSRADFAALAEGVRRRTMAVLRVAFLSSTVLELFSAIGVALVAVYVGFSLLGEITFGAWARPMTLGEGVFILLLAPEFFQPLRDLAAAWHDKAAAEAVADELEARAARAAADAPGTGARVGRLA